MGEESGSATLCCAGGNQRSWLWRDSGHVFDHRGIIGEYTAKVGKLFHQVE